MATSFGQVFDAWSTPGDHYICYACVGYGLDSAYPNGVKVVAVAGNRQDESAIFVEATDPSLDKSSLIVLGTNSGNRCGQFVKRMIFSFVGDVRFMGWKIIDTEDDDANVEGSLTIKVIEDNATRFFILRSFNPHDLSDTPETYEMTFVTTGGNDLKSLLNSATSLYFDSDFSEAALFGDSFLIQDGASS